MLEFLSGLFGQMTFFLLHVDHTAAFPPALTRAEEEECLRRLAQGDDAARQMLISHNLRLVAHMTKKFYAPDREQEELISIGTLGQILLLEFYWRFLFLNNTCRGVKNIRLVKSVRQTVMQLQKRTWLNPSNYMELRLQGLGKVREGMSQS